MKTELNYTKQGKKNRPLFFDNDIHFFVEDKGKEYQYEILFEKMFGKDLDYKIFGLNGKQTVLEYFNEKGERFNKVTNIYILDLDFDDYFSKILKKRNIIYLERYNIESYLICENAIYEFIRVKFEMTIKNTKKIFDFNKWYTDILDSYKQLFYLYIIVQKNNPKIENVGVSIGKKVNRKNGSVDIDYYNEYNEMVTKTFSKINIIDEMDSLDEIYKNNLPKLVCGKHIIHSLYVYLCSKKKGSIKLYGTSELNIFLIRNVDSAELDYIKKRIISIIN
ncbi:MAG: hypothetical protein ACOX4W_00285 [Bacilli bacterium]